MFFSRELEWSRSRNTIGGEYISLQLPSDFSAELFFFMSDIYILFLLEKEIFEVFM